MGFASARGGGGGGFTPGRDLALGGLFNGRPALCPKRAPSPNDNAIVGADLAVAARGPCEAEAQVGTEAATAARVAERKRRAEGDGERGAIVPPGDFGRTGGSGRRRGERRLKGGEASVEAAGRPDPAGPGDGTSWGRAHMAAARGEVEARRARRGAVPRWRGFEHASPGDGPATGWLRGDGGTLGRGWRPAAGRRHGRTSGSRRRRRGDDRPRERSILPGAATAEDEQELESRRATVDVFLQAAGYLDCAIHHVLLQMPPEKRRELPVDLAEGNLKALSLQGLGQGVDMQLGLAIDNPKATLAVKRRLACEMIKYWQQVKDSIPELPLSDGWGEKHMLFVKWKYVEAEAAAYYFHGLILDEGNTEKSHKMAISALEASEEFLKESKRASEAFHSTPPTSRSSTPFGTTKYLLDNIPKDTLSKVQNNQDLYSQERTSNKGINRIIMTPPPLPDFPLALNPEDYELPQLDPLWKKEANHR